MNISENAGVRKMRDFYAMKKNAPIYHAEFGYYAMDRWKREGYVKDGEDLNELFGFDSPGKEHVGGLGWCEAAFIPEYEVKVLEDRGEYELEQDHAGRRVLYFKNRRSGFMPEYVDHPVKDMYTWEKDVKWRMDPKTPERYKDMGKRTDEVLLRRKEGQIVCQNVIGGYMYLRSLIGPEQLLYKFYDDPELIHDCMRTWFTLADTIIEAHQRRIVFDELFFGEDICYKSGPLISPDMIREFLFPYYTQLFENMKKRQGGGLHLQIDTDGDARPVIPLYEEIGMDYMSPFEVASGCDVVEIRKQYPGLLMRGGIDKRILAAGKESIDRELERIIPFMRERGGYIPTCDHGVPEEVGFEDYMHYRKRIHELGD